MSDFISRQAAIEETWKEPSYADPLNVLTEMRDRLRALPSAQPEPLVKESRTLVKDLVKDTISRREAIDEIEERKNANGYRNVAVISELNRLEGYIMRLPSAQPELSDAVYQLWKRAYEAGERSTQPKIVRCKDCKHSEFWYRDKRRCFLWHEEGIDVFEDGFCNYAERRTDE